jgi:hypothetical protein
LRYSVPLLSLWPDLWRESITAMTACNCNVQARDGSFCSSLSPLRWSMRITRVSVCSILLPPIHPRSI